MRRSLAISLLIISCIASYAQTQPKQPARVAAYQGVILRVQPNSDTIYVRLHGDERNHWMTLEDGTTLVKENNKGYICYAKKKKNGQIVATRKKVKQTRSK